MSCGVGCRLVLLLAVARSPGSYISDSTPSLGTSICRRCGPKKQKKERKKEKILLQIYLAILLFVGGGGRGMFVKVSRGRKLLPWGSPPPQGLLNRIISPPSPFVTILFCVKCPPPPPFLRVPLKK